MSKHFARIAALISASLSQTSEAIVEPAHTDDNQVDDVISPALLNATVSDWLAQHRSHRSHQSHGSHRSSSGGSSRPAPRPAPAPPQPAYDPLGQQAREQGSVPPAQCTESQVASTLTNPELRKNIIMRMQLALQFEGLYTGAFSGVMDEETRVAVLSYKKIKGIPGTSVLDAATLNALGISGC